MLHDIERHHTPEEIAYGAYSVTTKQVETDSGEIRVTIDLLEELMADFPASPIGVIFDALEQVGNDRLATSLWAVLVKTVFTEVENKARASHPQLINKHGEIYTTTKIAMIEKLLERLAQGWNGKSLGMDNQTLQEKYYMLLVTKIIY